MLPNYFKKFMIDIFRDIPVFIYMDDILIATKEVKEHEKILRQVIDRLKEWKLVVNLKKSKIFQQRVEYLGLIIEEGSAQPKHKTIKEIWEMKVDSKETLRSFLGMVRMISRFLNPKIVKPVQKLNKMTSVKLRWLWNEEADEKLQEVKKYVISYLKNKFFDKSKERELYVDACVEGIGGCLVQEGELVRAYHKSFSGSSKKWSIVEKEAFAIVNTISRFSYLLFGRKFKVFTDHKPLIYLIKSVQQNKASAKVQRWFMMLSG